MTTERNLLEQQRNLLAERLDAIERCLHFLSVSAAKLNWPLEEAFLRKQKKNADLFETLAALNERFSKLQDILAATMRQAAGLAGEETGNFLRVLSFFEKCGVVEDSETWQACRTFRNLSAHEYSTDPLETADHFNSLIRLAPFLARTSGSLLNFCRENLQVSPKAGDFSAEFPEALARFQR